MATTYQYGLTNRYIIEFVMELTLKIPVFPYFNT